VNGALAELIAEFWDSSLVTEAAQALLKSPRPEPSPWAELLEGMVL
jgi:hypothetical protein